MMPPHSQFPPMNSYPNPPSNYPSHPSSVPQNPPYLPPPMLPMHGRQRQGLEAGTDGGTEDQEEEGSRKSESLGFSHRSVRKAFVKKVFLLTGVMLIIVTVMAAIPFMFKSFREFIQQHPYIYYLGYVMYLVCSLPILCCNVGRHFPLNYVLLLGLTLSMGFMVMVMGAFHTITSCLIAAFVTMGITFACALFAAFAPCDVTGCGFFAFICCIGLMIFGIVVGICAWVSPIFTWLHALYAGLAIILIIFIMIMELQQIFGGRKYEISEEDYVYASATLFGSICTLFQFVLSFMK